MEIYHRRLIAYSLGNFAGYHNFGLDGVLGDSAVLHVTALGDAAPSAPGRISSVRLVDAGMPVPDPRDGRGADRPALPRRPRRAGGPGGAGGPDRAALTAPADVRL